MTKKTLRDLPDSELLERRVLVRADFNVPMDNDVVTDDTRIRATLPTLQYLVERRARIVLLSHLGRPKGQWKPEYTLLPVAERLRKLADAPVDFVGDVIGPSAHEAVDRLSPGEMLLLENLRFLPGEETNDPQLSEALAGFGDVYVDDAFGTAHRAHASTCGVPEAMKADGKPAVAGFLVDRELRFLGRALDDPKRPFIAILGGAKISGKIEVLEALLPRVDHLLVGGAMANTFFRALGLETGTSLVEEDRVDMARDLLDRAADRLMLPVDCVVAAEAKEGSRASVVSRDSVPADRAILDIGPASVAAFAGVIHESGTVVWNGPMGLAEIEAFAAGTLGVATALAAATDQGAVTVAGGGDTAAALAQAGLTDRVTHVSTGGGASLEFLEGRALPGIAVLDDSTVA